MDYGSELTGPGEARQQYGIHGSDEIDGDEQQLRYTTRYTRAKELAYKLEQGENLGSTSEMTDTQLLAIQKGLDVEDVEKSIEFQDTFYDYALALDEKKTGQLSAFWVEPVPSLKGHIRFVGVAPQGAMEEIAEVAELSNGNIVVSTNGNISLQDNRQRAVMVAQALFDQGFKRFLTYYDVEDHTLHIEMKIDPGASASGLSVEKLHPAIVEHFQNANATAENSQKLQGRASVLHQQDLKLTVIRGKGEMMELEAQKARGGNKLNSVFSFRCTSGWSVWGSNGGGIMTAAHCAVNRFKPESGVAWGMNHIRQHWGLNGDVEYHTTQRKEIGEFYTREGYVRSLQFHRDTNSMKHKSVCVYGRASNVRSCNHTVEEIDITEEIGGVLTGNLARTDNDTSICGDSGSGWSFNNTAWGVHSGSDGSHSWFTTIEEAMDTLDVYLIAG